MTTLLTRPAGTRRPQDIPRLHNGDRLKQAEFHRRYEAMPEGVKAETPTQTEIVIKGVNRQQVGQVAAEVRAYKPPEPYKGKGVRYSDETIVIKETKKK